MAQQDRRAWMLETLGALGLLSAGASGVFAQHDHVAAASSPRDALTAAGWKPSVLSPDEDRTLSTLADAIVPGSAAAYGNRVIDLLLTLETESVRATLRESIAAFDQTSQARWHQPFSQLLPAQQTLLLKEASAKNASLSSHFENVKSWVADVYWSSQQGMRDLGFKGRMAWTTFPGCAHGGAHT